MARRLVRRFALAVLLLQAGQEVSGDNVALKQGEYIAVGLGITRAARSSSSTTTTTTTSDLEETSTSRHTDIVHIEGASSTSSMSTSIDTQYPPPTTLSTTRTSSSSSTTSPASHTSSLSHSTSGPVAKTGSGMEYANSCNQALYSWTKSYVTYSDGLCTKTATQQEAEGEGGSHQTTKLCDGIPRMLPNFTTPSTSAVKHCKTDLTLDEAPPKPTCSIQPSDCASLMTSFSQAHGVPSNVDIVTHAYYRSIYKDYPRCVTRSGTCTLGGDAMDSPGCAVYGDGIQLFYWPQIWADGLCGESKHAVTMGPTISGKPNTATISGYTLTSPTVYIKYDALYASDACSTKIGTVLEHGLIPMISEEVSTKVPWFWTNIPWSGPSGMAAIAQTYGIIPAMTQGWPGINTDYADQFLPLQYPDLDLPGAEAYYAMRLKGMDCWSQGCPTMIPWQHHPVLAIPDKVRMMVPEWESCSLPWGAMNDPPVALAKVDQIAGLTRPAGDGPTVQTTGAAQTTAISASPCITPTPMTPTPTGNAMLTRPKASTYDPPTPSPAKEESPAPESAGQPDAWTPNTQHSNPAAHYTPEVITPTPTDNDILTQPKASAYDPPASSPAKEGSPALESAGQSDAWRPDTQHSNPVAHYTPEVITALPYSAAKTEIAIGGSIVQVHLITDGDQAIKVVLGSETMTPDSKPVTIDGQLYRIGKSAVEVLDTLHSTAEHTSTISSSDTTILDMASDHTRSHLFVYDPDTTNQAAQMLSGKTSTTRSTTTSTDSSSSSSTRTTASTPSSSPVSNSATASIPASISIVLAIVILQLI